MLGVEHDQQEAEDDTNVQEDADDLHELQGRQTQRLHQRGDPVGEERSGELAVDRELGTAVELQRPQDVEDHEEHQPCRTGVRAEEARVATLLGGIVDQANDGEDHDPDEDENDEQVLEEENDGPGADDGEPEVLDVHLAQGLDDRDAEDEESPEGEDVSDAGDGPLQQLLLAQHLGALKLSPFAHVTGPADRGLAGADHALKEEDAADRKDGRRHDHGCAEHDADDVEGVHGREHYYWSVTPACSDVSRMRCWVRGA